MLPQQGTAVAQAGNDLELWLHKFAKYQQAARYFVNSVWVQKSYKPDIARNASPQEIADAIEVAAANACGAMMFGDRIGLDPITSLQQVFVIHGRPGLYAKVKVAMAQASGHRIRTPEWTAESVTVCGQAAGSEIVNTITITMEMATRAGWTTNATYAKTPEDMLWNRAAGRVCDQTCGYLYYGIPTVDDLADMDPVPVMASIATGEPTPERTTRAAILAAAGQSRPDGADPDVRAVQDFAAADRAENDTPAPAMPEMPIVERVVLPITDPQRRQLGALMGQLDVSGAGSKERRLRIASTIAGRELGSANDLTQDEASMVIDTLTSISVGDSATRRRLLAELDGTATATPQAAADADDIDPTVEADWGMDGAEAAAEGQQ
jgi:hypothetical protein